VLGKLLSGTFWLALRTPLQAISAFWSIPLMLGAFGEGMSGAYWFAWNFGFFQMLLEFGMSSALQREVSERWTRGDRAGVDRAISCGTVFYAVIALVQAATLMIVAYGAMPHSEYAGREYRLIIHLLWLQALTSPSYGISVVVSSILQAARRYEVLPRFEVLIVALRLGVLVVGVGIGAGLMALASAQAEQVVSAGGSGIVGLVSSTALGVLIRHLAVGPALLTVVIAQTVVQVGLSLGPALWVISRKLDYRPRFTRVRLGDFRTLARFSFYMFLIQLSVVIADKVDTTILSFVLDSPGEAVAAYKKVSSPFLQLRQLGWTLAYLVMPAVASLAAVGDREGLDRVTYDGARLHTAAFLPVGLLAFLYAGPFLELWVGGQVAGQEVYSIADLTWLMRLFLVAALPLFIAVHVQAATGLGRIALVAVAALAGAVVNLPLSLFLTYRLGLSGVIWGTVLTTLFSNLLIPAFYVFRVLDVRPSAYFSRTLLAPLAGGGAMILASWLLVASGYSAVPRGDHPLSRALPFAVHLSVGSLAFVAGYAIIPVGRSDLHRLLGRLLGRGLG
jgi:O-antigen/teichoic acid export membrane protein